MAIFKKEKKEKGAEVVSEKGAPSKRAGSSVSYSRNVERVLTRPHITEKASALAEKGVYVFEVDKRATKISIRHAVKEIYRVTPLKVNIVRLPAKQVVVRGKKGMKPGKKKALVYLKKGDTIEII